MVDHNKQKKEAFRKIEAFVEQGRFNKDDICFFIMKNTGFGNKFTIDFIDEHLKRDFWEENKKNGHIQVKTA